MRFFANAQNDFDLHGFDGEGGGVGGGEGTNPHESN